MSTEDFITLQIQLPSAEAEELFTDYVRLHLSLCNDFNLLKATQDYGPVPTYNLESKSQFCPEAVLHSTMKNGPCSKSWHSHGNL